MLSIRPSPGKGRGVFAEKRFVQGERLERAPIILIPAEEWDGIEKTVLYYYIYTFGPNLEHAAVALGYGSLYNHSYRPNAVYVKRWEEQVIDIIALRDIETGEEITINYNGSPDDQKPLWFDTVD